MNDKSFYHVCSDGRKACNFIISELDFIAAFNIVGVAAAFSNAFVVAFSLEESHPHFLLFGTLEQCLLFKTTFERIYSRYLISTRKSLDGVTLDCDMYEITDEMYLKTVGTYVISQATKDGKKIMPYDYTWGTGSMYFRPEYHISLWRFNRDGQISDPIRIDTISASARRLLLHTGREVPGNWTICNGLLLPDNYVKVAMFENIYKTHNCFRVFLASSKDKDNAIHQRMSEQRGVMLDDLEARKICKNLEQTLFGISDVRKLNPNQRVQLGYELRKNYRLSLRQISTLTRLPYTEIEKYIK